MFHMKQFATSPAFEMQAEDARHQTVDEAVVALQAAECHAN